MLSDRLFQEVMGDQISRVRHLHNGHPQGSVLASGFFNIYTAGMPVTISKKFTGADDMALAMKRTIKQILNDFLYLME